MKEKQKEIIIQETHKHFGKGSSVLLCTQNSKQVSRDCGSDLLIIPCENQQNNFFRRKIELLVDLKKRLYDLDFDILVKEPGDTREKVKKAMNYGEKLY